MDDKPLLDDAPNLVSVGWTNPSANIADTLYEIRETMLKNTGCLPLFSIPEWVQIGPDLAENPATGDRIRLNRSTGIWESIERDPEPDVVVEKL